VDRIEHQEIIGHQGVNQGAPGLFQAHRDRPAAQALAQLGQPGSEHFGLLLQRAGFDFALADHLQAEGVFLKYGRNCLQAPTSSGSAGSWPCAERLWTPTASPCRT